MGMDGRVLRTTLRSTRRIRCGPDRQVIETEMWRNLLRVAVIECVEGLLNYWI